MLQLVALAAVVLFAWTTQAMTGFGAIVLALTLGSHLVPISELMPVLVALNLPLCLHITWRERAHIDRQLLLRGILPLMSAGMLLGVSAAPWLDGPTLRRGFGLMVTVVALRHLVGLLRGRQFATASPWQTRALMLGSGVTHGLWASGGPLLVMALSGTDRERRSFRATLMTVWLVFNVVLIGLFTARGTWDTTAAWRIAVLLPLLPIGIAIGDRLHHRVPERVFQGAVQAVLLFAGAALLP